MTTKTLSKVNEKFKNDFLALRNVSIPIAVIRSYDLVETVSVIKSAHNPPLPLVQWDASRGITPVNDMGAEAMKDLGIVPAETVGFHDALVVVLRLPKKSCVIAHNAHRQLLSMEPIATAAAIQAIVNLRGAFKTTARMLAMIGPEWVRPPEIEAEVIAIAHDLPDAEALAAVVTELHQGYLDPPDAKTLDKATHALSGLSTFIAEQATALSMSQKGLNTNQLWDRKRQIIATTPGLSVYGGTETFKDLRGLDSIKRRLSQHIDAKTPIGVVPWIDEGADVFANVEGGGDSNGVKTDQQRALLVEMEQNNWRGVILCGVPGSGKSAIARAFGNEAGVPTIQVDFGGMESKWQGESEGNLRRAIDVIKAVGRGNAFFVLTCNSLTGIRPQFQRRFKRGIFFFDLPTKEEREVIWKLYEEKYQIKRQPRPNDDGWTGAEIRECCESAWDCNMTLLAASKFIMPVARSRATEIQQMRREAHNRFLDASKEGPYLFDDSPMAAHVRAMTLPAGESVN